MGGLPCAKEIIDNGHAVRRSLGCMDTSILLNAEMTQPTQEQSDEFRAAAENLAKVAAKIERYVSQGGPYEAAKSALDAVAPPGDKE